MATKFIDYETKVCADWLNTVDDAVFDALGSPSTPEEARNNINAVEEAPADGGSYLRKNESWAIASTALLHNDLAGRDAADGHPQTAVTGLSDRLDAIEQKNTDQDALFADKLDTDVFDAYVIQQDARDDGQDTLIATKASTSYVDSENNAQDLLIAGNADVSYVDAQNTAQTAELLGLIIALG